ncbi:MAG TPA: hypothetical protein VGK02_00970 [Candidatus Aquicultor sp.]|jgi:hypothetical protein
MKIRICHLYPDAMNLYGDRGNIISIAKRCQWRDIKVEVVNVNLGDSADFNDVDIIFFGGGQDRSQVLASRDLIAKGPAITDAIESDVVALTICGGYQLFGKYFKTGEGTEIPGIGVYDAITISSNKRMIGNISVDCRQTSLSWPSTSSFSQLGEAGVVLVGFENHSGKTYLGERCGYLGHVIRGYGNDDTGHLEGCRYLRAFGTYLHGPLLPKNPWFTDYLIAMALQHRYGTEHELKVLDDTIENAAHSVAINRTYR